MAELKSLDPNTLAGDFQPLRKTESGLDTLKKETDKRFVDIERLTKTILFVASISLVSVDVAVSGLVLDQMHFNNQTYIQQASDDKQQIRLLQNEIEILKSKEINN